MRRKEKSLIEKIEKEKCELLVIPGLEYWDGWRKIKRQDAPCCAIEIYSRGSWLCGYSCGIPVPKDGSKLLGTIEVAAYDMVFKDQGIRIKSCSEELRQYETTIEDVLDAVDFLRSLSGVTDGCGYSILHYVHVLECEAKKQRRGGPTWDEHNGY